MKMAGSSNMIGSVPGSDAFICGDLPLLSLRFPDYCPHNGNYSLAWCSENAVRPDITRGTLHATTYAIFGLLGVILAPNIVTIVLSSERGGGGRLWYRRVVPQSPGTIAALASLLADSNIFLYLLGQSQ